MIEENGPWWDFEECGWCHKLSECAVLYRSVEAGRSWSSVWFACAACATDAPALISAAGSVQSLKIEPVWFWWVAPSLGSEPGPGHSFNTLWPTEQKWVRWLGGADWEAELAWRVVREGWRAGTSVLA